MKALVVVLFAGACDAFALQRVAPPAQSCETARSRRTAIRAVADDTDSSAPKITIRKPSERAQAAATEEPPAAVENDSTTTVTIKAPTKAPPPPPPPPQEPLTPEMEKQVALLQATQRANCTALLEALQAGANPNAADRKGRTPLHFVAGVGLAPAAVLLIHFGAQIDCQDNDGLTPMHMASGYANAQTLRVLVSAGADPELKGEAQGTPFEVVSALGDYQLQEFFKGKQGLQGRFKKKDDKLEKLRACMDVLDNVEDVRATADWDLMLTEVMKAIAPVV